VSCTEPFAGFRRRPDGGGADSKAPNPPIGKGLTLSTVAAEPTSEVRFSVVELYESGLSSRRLWAHDERGQRFALPVDEWCADNIAGDASLLARCIGSTLDVGCGPGRLTAALTARGTEALGIDISALAVSVTKSRVLGTRAVQRSVFGPVPGSGRWSCALLADGNIGIGGDPVALLQRLRQLIAPTGSVHVELAAPGALNTAQQLRLEDERRRVSETFPWAEVGVDGLDAIAAAGSFLVTERWDCSGRWFASLRRA
jgi:SAM-dependent methyltransferase